MWTCRDVGWNERDGQKLTVDSWGSKTRNTELHCPKCERGVRKCSKWVSRGYRRSLSAKTAVEAKQGFENCLIWVKNTKRETGQARTRAEGLELFEIDA